MDIQTKQTPAQAPLLSWSAPVMPEHEKSHQWYLAAATVAVASAAYGIVIGAWTFSLVVILMAGVYYLLRHTPPPVKHIRLHAHGFELDAAYTPWTGCKDFWLIALSGYTELHITKKQGWDREVVIQTDNIDPNAIRKTIAEFLPERPNQKERLLDSFIRFTKL
jgi:hypothetical protein